MRGLALLKDIDESALPAEYRAEVDYTRALVSLSARRFDEAVMHVERGLGRAVRPSSERNAFFLLGRILAAAGDIEGADSVFERGASHAYRGQGGDGLLCWARVLNELGRTRDARYVLERCIERDPQSHAAQEAKKLLSGSSPS